MTDRHLVPDVVRDLESPFALTRRELRRCGIATESAEVLIDVFDRALAGLEAVPIVIHDHPPSGLFYWPDFGSELLARAMPVLSSITLEGVASRLRELGDRPTPGDVEVVGRWWVRLILESLRKMVLSALSVRADEGKLSPYAAEFLAVVERRVDGQGPIWGRVMVGSIAWDVGLPAMPVLKRIAASEALDPIVRQHAQHKLYALARKFG